MIDLLFQKEDLNAFFKATFNLSDKNYDRVAKSKVDRLIGSHNDRFNVKCRGNKTFFHSKNKDWLDRELICDEEELISDDNNNANDDDIAASSELKRRKLKAFEQCAERTMNERCAVLRESVPTSKSRKHFFVICVGKDNLWMQKSSKIAANEHRREDESFTRNGERHRTSEIHQGTPLFIDGIMTKAQYELIAHGAVEKNAPIYPPCNNILEAKKECYPPKEFINISDDSVTKQFQTLLDITCRRKVLLSILNRAYFREIIYLKFHQF